MEKEQMKQTFLELADNAEVINPLLGMADDMSLPYEVLEILTEGRYFTDFRTVSMASQLRVACASGQLTQREVPNQDAVFISTGFIKRYATMLNVLAEMPVEKAEELIDNYEEFAPVANKIKQGASLLVEACITVLSMMEDYIAETRVEPFKENWSDFQSSLEGLSQTLEAVVKHYGTDKEWTIPVRESIECARELSRELKVLGDLYESGEPTGLQVKKVIETLDSGIAISAKANTAMEAQATYEARETFGYLVTMFKNMKDLS